MKKTIPFVFLLSVLCCAPRQKPAIKFDTTSSHTDDLSTHLHTDDSLKIPDFFRESKSKSEISILCERSWGHPVIELPSEDLERIQTTKDKVIEDTWNNYQRIITALTSGKAKTYQYRNEIEHKLEADNTITSYEHPINQLKPSDLFDDEIDYFINLQNAGHFYTTDTAYSYLRGLRRQIGRQIAQFEHTLDLARIDRLIELNKKTINLTQWNRGSLPPSLWGTDEWNPYGAMLIMDVSNSAKRHVTQDLQDGSDVNQYSAAFGNNPIVLAVMKGWNHNEDNENYSMSLIIKALLAHPELNVNSIDLKTGMTALHIACLRGDAPELIHRLLQKGARLDIRDYSGNTPMDILNTNISWTEAESKISSLGGVVTLPSESDRRKNQEYIKHIMPQI